jgi:hypothetical protein
MILCIMYIFKLRSLTKFILIKFNIYKATWALQWQPQGKIGFCDTQIGPPICARTHSDNILLPQPMVQGLNLVLFIQVVYNDFQN